MKKLIVMALIGAGLVAISGESGDKTIAFSASDQTMNDAQISANDSLPAFFTNALQADGTSIDAAMVKVAFDVVRNEESGVEVIWIGPFSRSGDDFEGVLANNPNDMPEKLGDTVSFSESMIRDWMITGPDGRLYGNYTTRVMLKDMSAEAVAHLKGILSEQPVPGHW